MDLNQDELIILSNIFNNNKSLFSIEYYNNIIYLYSNIRANNMTVIKNYSTKLIINFLSNLISENLIINLNNINTKLNNINYFDDLKLEFEIELLNEI
jgi:hypothetical protein